MIPKRATRRLAVLASGLALLACSSCLTVNTSLETWPDPNLFGGVRADVGLVGDSRVGLSGRIFGAVDLPFSLALDVLLIPVNLILFI